MKFSKLNRKIHYWISLTIALPALVIICSGLMLQMKKHWEWVQPTEHRGMGTKPNIDFAGILGVVKDIPQLGVTGWSDINRLDVRPGRGLVKVWLHNGWEVQVDLGTGQVLHTAYRRSDLIESIHDGSFFAGNLSKLGIFLPSGVSLLLLLITGLSMFRFLFPGKRKRKKAAKIEIV
ncbi:MAG TPA: hypothetical protein VK186_09825 [Candidatus Deferrimicrobium sp.]|nr:PepSY domain-containing protein [Candidatus Kapabacteria bacterium]HLP59119.1 hypothetical protein [Candidatus Deferrimicrobium sp.]